jgi:hypothetical protein
LVAITWTISPKPAVQSVFSFGRAKSSSSSCSTDLIRPINEYQHEHLERKRIVATTTNPTTEGRAKKRRTKTRKTNNNKDEDSSSSWGVTFFLYPCDGRSNADTKPTPFFRGRGEMLHFFYCHKIKPIKPKKPAFPSTRAQS